MESPGKQAFLDLIAVIWQEGPAFVSLCPELGVSSCGSSLEEATAMLQEAVDLYLENARQLEILDATLDNLASTRRWTTSIRVAL